MQDQQNTPELGEADPNCRYCGGSGRSVPVFSPNTEDGKIPCNCTKGEAGEKLFCMNVWIMPAGPYGSLMPHICTLEYEHDGDCRCHPDLCDTTREEPDEDTPIMGSVLITCPTCGTHGLFSGFDEVPEPAYLTSGMEYDTIRHIAILECPMCTSTWTVE